MINKFIQISLLIICFSNCNQSNNLILMKHNFNKGNWILVNVNYAEKTLEIIDDEEILKTNREGIKVTSFGECGGTTCDGFLKLYKDGILIKEDEYLSRTKMNLIESTIIKKAYKKGKEWTINPSNDEEFDRLWDSLKIANCYPTKYHTQPADKDIIWAYKIE